MLINSPRYVIGRCIDSSPGQEPRLPQERANPEPVLTAQMETVYPARREGASATAPIDFPVANGSCPIEEGVSFAQQQRYPVTHRLLPSSVSETGNPSPALFMDLCNMFLTVQLFLSRCHEQPTQNSLLPIPSLPKPSLPHTRCPQALTPPLLPQYKQTLLHISVPAPSATWSSVFTVNPPGTRLRSPPRIQARSRGEK